MLGIRDGPRRTIADVLRPTRARRHRDAGQPDARTGDIAAVVRSRSVPVMVDSTFATRSFSSAGLGAALVLHSATKFLASW